MADSSPVAALRQRVMTDVTRRFFVRSHMALIFMGLVLSGVLASKVLLVAGVRWMALRYILAVICSYLVFFLLVRLWLAYIALGRSRAFDSERAGFEGRGATAGLEDADSPEPSRATVRGVPSGGRAPDLRGHGVARALSGPLDVDLGEGVAALILFLLLLTVIGGVGLYLVVQAPAILGEAAFQMALAAALSRASRGLDVAGWGGSVFRATWVGFALVLVIAGAFGWVAQHHCPWVAKVGEMFFGCVLEP